MLLDPPVFFPVLILRATSVWEVHFSPWAPLAALAGSDLRQYQSQKSVCETRTTPRNPLSAPSLVLFESFRWHIGTHDVLVHGIRCTHVNHRSLIVKSVALNYCSIVARHVELLVATMSIHAVHFLHDTVNVSLGKIN